ncbi:hypothetical protein PsYK624_130270 [Phanerochaete sordida]|uniref:Uncharacterized protein n=1 Tax=Phanerochaete sordida TaxID=48140 RepID=A0A9P3LIX9_9APHY|nr:hypothetical protein PsYK624_130270 [Phanerochaete sordida]
MPSAAPTTMHPTRVRRSSSITCPRALPITACCSSHPLPGLSISYRSTSPCGAPRETTTPKWYERGTFGSLLRRNSASDIVAGASVGMCLWE